MKKRVLSAALSVCILLTLLPTAALASAFSEKESEITISAETGETVTVKEKEPEPGPAVDGLLYLTTLDHTIQRDYEQECMITVRNTSDETQEFYLETNNTYDDLSMEIIKIGSKSNPAIISAGESIQVELSIFAQNAERESYNIPITAYILSDGKYSEDTKDNVTLSCNLPYLDLAWAKVSSSESTLRQTWKVTNNGDTLTDLTISADESLQDYLSFSPIVTNYEMSAGSSIEIEVQPDLAKMKSNSISELTGSLIMSCAGKTSEQEVVFNTKGKEITVTSMGQLVLKQEGNPITNFEVEKSSVQYQYYDGEKFVDSSSATSVDDILDNKNLFDISYSSNVDVGAVSNLPIEIQTKSSMLEDGATIKESTVEYDTDGSLVVHLYSALTVDEYNQAVSSSTTNLISATNLTDSTDSTNNIKSPLRLMAKGDSFEEGERFVLETTFKLSNIKGGVDFIRSSKHAGMLDPDPLSYGAIDMLSDMYNYGCILEGINDISRNPYLTQQDKVNFYGYSAMKTILTAGKMAVTLTNPIVGFFFSNVVDLTIEKLLDDELKDMRVYANDLMENYINIEGRQCTNRGHITVPFYVPNYSGDNSKKPNVKATGRMYGDGYVDKSDTNYDITLNGNPAGKVTNGGLTDVTIADIPNDNLRLGKKNVIVFDYDTNPGSHFVTSDTEITILYPADTEIAYIGDPDDLQDVRTKPDFCVYSENIYGSDDLVVGESGKLNFNVYNRGSRGGWFNLICYDGTTVIHEETNYYMDAFSGHTFSVDWIPTATSNSIRVELTNTSVNLEERSTSNNSAITTVTARQREIPLFNTFSTQTIYEKQSFSVVVDVLKATDVTSADFTLDGTTKPSEVRQSPSGDRIRYWLSFEKGLEAGNHTISASVKYKTSPTIEATLSDTFDLPISEEVWSIPAAYFYDTTLLYGDPLEFFVEDTKNLSKVEVQLGTEPALAVKPTSISDCGNDYKVDLSKYAAGDYTVTVTTYYKDRNGNEVTKQFTDTITLISEADSYYTVTLSDQMTTPSFFVYHFSSNVNCEFEKISGTTYRCPKTKDMVEVPEKYTVIIAYDYGIALTDMSKSGETLSASGTQQLTIQKTDKDTITEAYISRITDTNNYTYYVDIPVKADKSITLSTGKYSVYLEGTVDGVGFGRSTDVDLTSQDQAIDIDTFALIYYFDIVSTPSDYYEAVLCTKKAGDSHWNTSYLQSDLNSKTLKCYTTNSSALSQIEDSDEANIIIYSDQELYQSSLNNTTLDRSALNKVTLTCDDRDWEIGELNVLFNSFSAYMAGDTIYVPDGDYKIIASLSSGSTVMESGVQANIADDCIISLNKDISNYHDVVVNWPSPFENTGSINYSSGSNNLVYMNNFTNGGAFKSPIGKNYFGFYLTCTGNEFYIDTEYTVTESDNKIEIDNQFDGDLSGYFSSAPYDGGATVNVKIENAVDKNGNHLSNVWTDNLPLFGKATFTDVDDGSKTFSTPIRARNLNSFDITLPEESGTYSLTVELTTNAVYVVTFDSQGGSFVESASVKHGDMVTKPTDPSKENYRFDGWYTDSECTEAYSFNSPVTDDITLYAKWATQTTHSGSASTTYTLTFETNGGSAISKVTKNKGTSIDLAQYAPTKSGATFEGWYADKGLTKKITSVKLDANTTVYAKWTEAPVSGLPFGDVKSADWFYNDVKYVYEKGMMAGTAADVFAPNATTTRAMIVTILYRLEGSPAVTGTSAFVDVPAGQWYTDAVNWAAANQIVKGTSATTFAPNDSITREQMAAILYRYAQYKGYDVTKKADLSGYSDNGQVSAYAKDALAWANAAKLINGVTNTTLAPQGNATRAQVSAILHRFCDGVVK